MDTTPEVGGVLFPTSLPSFHREPPPQAVARFVRWFWVPRWNLPPGETRRQELLPFPATNLVVQPDGVIVSGPATRIAHRDLSGSGWAVGALLRPAGTAAHRVPPETLLDDETPFAAEELHRSVADAMADDEEDAGRSAAVAAFTDWILATLEPPGETALLANRVEELVRSDRTILRVEQLADRVGVSARSLQRLSRRHFGLPPLAVIRRYRLQEAATRLRQDPGVTVAQVAAELGYADHAHLTADFTRALGFPPRTYKQRTDPRGDARNNTPRGILPPGG